MSPRLKVDGKYLNSNTSFTFSFGHSPSHQIEKTKSNIFLNKKKCRCERFLLKLFSTKLPTKENEASYWNSSGMSLTSPKKENGVITRKKMVDVLFI